LMAGSMWVLAVRIGPAAVRGDALRVVDLQRGVVDLIGAFE